MRHHHSAIARGAKFFHMATFDLEWDMRIRTPASSLGRERKTFSVARQESFSKFKSPSPACSFWQMDARSVVPL